MSTKQDLIYRQVVTLKDGSRVLLRPLIKEDRQALMNLFTTVSPEDRKYFRSSVSDPKVVGSWVDTLDYAKVLPIVALFGEQIIAEASLHFNTGPTRHIGEVRVYLAPDFRFRGLASRLLNAVIDLARRRSVYMLEARAVTDAQAMIKSFQNVGFITKCVYEGYFMTPDGQLHDQVHMLLRLRSEDDSF
jgi:L-amino acid N-acyltransferase YncA